MHEKKRKVNWTVFVIFGKRKEKYIVLLAWLNCGLNDYSKSYFRSMNIHNRFCFYIKFGDITISKKKKKNAFMSSILVNNQTAFPECFSSSKICVSLNSVFTVDILEKKLLSRPRDQLFNQFNGNVTPKRLKFHTFIIFFFLSTVATCAVVALLNNAVA